MGDSRSAIRDDIDDYESLCHEYNIKSVDCYSVHAKMLTQAARDCYSKLPPAKHHERIEQFKKDYENHIREEKERVERQTARLKILRNTLPKEDLALIEGGVAKIRV